MSTRVSVEFLVRDNHVESLEAAQSRGVKRAPSINSLVECSARAARTSTTIGSSRHCSVRSLGFIGPPLLNHPRRQGALPACTAPRAETPRRDRLLPLGGASRRWRCVVHSTSRDTRSGVPQPPRRAARRAPPAPGDQRSRYANRLRHCRGLGEQVSPPPPSPGCRCLAGTCGCSGQISRGKAELTRRARGRWRGSPGCGGYGCSGSSGCARRRTLTGWPCVRYQSTRNPGAAGRLPSRHGMFAVGQARARSAMLRYRPVARIFRVSRMAVELPPSCGRIGRAVRDINAAVHASLLRKDHANRSDTSGATEQSGPRFCCTYTPLTVGGPPTQRHN